MAYERSGIENAITVNRAMGAIKPDVQIDPGALYMNDFVKSVR